MVERVSALDGATGARRFGLIGEGGPRLSLSERRIESLWQIAAWPDRLAAAGRAAAALAGAEGAPGPGESCQGERALLVRTEPAKWLLAAGTEIAAPALDPADGTLLDLSHARTVIRVAGPAAPDLMARLVAIDLRLRPEREGRVAATGIHGTGVVILTRDGGYDLFVPRSFARALWDHLTETGAQFGVEIG